MANPKLTVEIDGDIRKLEAAVNRAEKLVVDFGKGTGGGASGGRNVFKPATDSANKYENQINDLSNAIDKYRSSNEEIVTSTRRTGDLMTDLANDISRVERELQDTIVISRGYAKEQDRLNRELQEGKISSQDYGKALDRLTRDEKETQVAVRDLRAELRRLKADYKTLNTGAQTVTKTTNATTQSVGKMAKTTRVNAVPAMTSFSQVVQDAPYGIQGVANNIQQLTMQMGYLSTQAGGTGGAMKALVSSLAGPAGILLAVSVVTSLLVKYGDELGALIGTKNKLTDATKEYVGEAVSEITEINRLIGVARNHNASIVSRRKAIDELNEDYGDYLGNLNLEQIESEKTTQKVDNLTKALIRQAQVRGLEDRIGEIAKETGDELTELQMRQSKAYNLVKQEIDDIITSNDLLNRRLGNVQGVNAQIKAIQELGNEQSDLGKLVRSRASGLQFAITNYKGVNDEIDQLQQNSQKALKPLTTLQTALEEQIFGAMDIDNNVEEVVITAKKKLEDANLRVPITPILAEGQGLMGDAQGFAGELEFKAKLDADLSLLKEAQSLFAPFTEEFKMFGEAIKFNEQRLEGFGSSLIESGEVGAEELKRIGEGLTAFSETQQNALLAQQEAFAERQKMIAGLIGNAFAQVSNQMVDMALEGKLSFDDLAKSVIKAVSSILTTLAAQAIGNAIVGATQASTAAGPAAPLVLPGLIVGMTGLVKNSFPAFQDGGIVGGNSLYGDKILARVNSQELILNRQQQAAVWGQMNTGATMGQSAPIDIQGEFVLQGENLRVALERNNRNRGRQT